MTLTTYTDTSGVFVNGVTPLSAANLNSVRSFLIAAGAMWDSNISADGSGNHSAVSYASSASLVLSGTTAGQVTFYQWLRGLVKATFVLFSGYENSSATEQVLTFPVAYTTRASYWANGGIPLSHFRNAGSQLSSKCTVITSLPSGTGAGAITTNSSINGFSSGEITAAFDSMGFGSGHGQTFSASVTIIGI